MINIALNQIARYVTERSKMKSSNLRPLTALLAVASLTAIACGLTNILEERQQGTPTAELAVPTPEPTAEVPVEKVQLDPCQLITEAEASEVLEGPVQMQPAGGTGGCIYLQQSDDPASFAQLVISAAQGEEAKAFTVFAVGLLAGFSGNPEMMGEFEALNDQLPDLSLAEVLNRMADLFQGAPLTVTQADGPGESALWLAYEDDFYSQGTLLVVRGEEYVSLTMIGSDLASAPDRLATLASTVFDRLPPAFFVLDEDGDGDFRFEFSVEVDLGDATEEPEPTLEVVNGLVWVTASNAGQVFAIDPMTNQAVATIDVGRFPSDIAVAEGNVWVVSSTEGILWRIDPNSFEVVDTISLGGNTLQVDAGQGSVWVTGGLGVRKIDLATGTRYDVVYNSAYDVAIGENSVWVSQSQDQQLLKIDPATRNVVATVKLDGQPTDISYGHGMVWVILYDRHEIIGIDPETTEVVTTLSSDLIIHALTVDLSRIWYSGPMTLNYVESSLSGAGSFEAQDPPYRMAFYAGSLWVTSPNEGTVTRYDPENLSLIAEIDLGVDPKAIAGGE
jgi:YVTN family beta-propeller protein